MSESKYTAVNIRRDTHQRFRKACDLMGVTITDVLEDLVTPWLDNFEKENAEELAKLRESEEAAQRIRERYNSSKEEAA